MNPNIVVTLYQHVVKTSRKTSLKTVVKMHPESHFLVRIHGGSQDLTGRKKNRQKGTANSRQ